MTEAELKALYQAHTTRAAEARPGCPTADELVAIVTGTPGRAERERVADHLMSCSDCAQELRLLQSLSASAAPTIRAESSRRRVPMIAWAAAAALIIATSAGVWLIDRGRRAPAPSPTEQQETPRTPVASTPPETSAAFEELARVDPPPHVTITLRSGDEDRFETAMERYTQGDYAGAAERLRTIAHAEAPPHVPFYLGVSELMIGNAEAAIEALQRVASARSAYAEHAHLLLAKAWLARQRAPEARRELTTCIALRAAHAGEARRLLDRLDAISRPDPR